MTTKAPCFTPIKYINLESPIAAREYVAYQRENELPLWKPLEGEHLALFQLRFLSEFERYQRERVQSPEASPSLLSGVQVNGAYRRYIFAVGALRYVDRNEFERQFAAEKAAEYHAVLECGQTVL